MTSSPGSMTSLSNYVIYPLLLCVVWVVICLVKKVFCKPQPWPDFGGRVTALSSVDDFETFVQREATRTQLIVIDCYAEWCGPCRRAAPVFAEWSEEMSGCAFAKVNTDSAADLSARLGVRVLPTFKIYRSSPLSPIAYVGAPREGGLQELAEVRGRGRVFKEASLPEPSGRPHAPGRPLCRWAHGVSLRRAGWDERQLRYQLEQHGALQDDSEGARLVPLAST